MDRRTLLATTAVAISGFLGGCSGTGNGDDGTNGSTATGSTSSTASGTTDTGSEVRTTTAEPPDPEPTTTVESTGKSATTSGLRTETAGGSATETTGITASPTASNATEATETTDIGSPTPGPSSTQEDGGTARVTFENGGRVVVSGVITTANGCQEATLASAQSNGTELVITVGTERSAGTNAMCTQALTPVGYRFVLTPDTAPESVTVIHATMGERRTVTTVERGG